MSHHGGGEGEEKNVCVKDEKSYGERDRGLDKICQMAWKYVLLVVLTHFTGWMFCFCCYHCVSELAGIGLGL